MDCETYIDWLERKLYLVEDREMELNEYISLYVQEEFETEIKTQFEVLGLTSTNKLPKQRNVPQIFYNLPPKQNWLYNRRIKT
ncbi:MAG: hypothetical protein WDM90_20585 [Ferruginibacter sp.]